MPFGIRTRADDADKHSTDVTAIVYHKDKLYSGADDGKIKVWEEDLKLVATIDGHSRSVYSLAIVGETLYSCSNDGTLKGWSLPDLKLKTTLLQSETEILKLWNTNDLLYAGDSEGSVRIFQDEKILSFVNLIEPVKDMVVIDNLIYTVRDLDLVISEIYPGDKGSFSTRETIMGRAPLCLVAGKLCFISRTGKDILVHESSAQEHFKQIAEIKDAHGMIINALVGVQSDNDVLLYSGGWDKTIKQWKLKGNSLENINSCNVDMCINVISAGPKGEVYVGGSDGHIVRVDV